MDTEAPRSKVLNPISSRRNPVLTHYQQQLPPGSMPGGMPVQTPNRRRTGLEVLGTGR